jgi:hypothetical protein
MTRDEQEERINDFMAMLDKFDATMKEAAASLDTMEKAGIREARVRLGLPDEVINCMLKYNSGLVNWDDARHKIMQALLKDKARN